MRAANDREIAVVEEELRVELREVVVWVVKGLEVVDETIARSAEETK